MRKRALIAAVVFGLGIFAGGTAEAVVQCTDIGCAAVDEGDYIVVLDGSLSNPNPFDGYVGITRRGVIACSEAGGPYSHPNPDGQHVPQDCPYV